MALRRCVVGVDVGTTSAKAVVVGEGGESIAHGASSTIPTLRPRSGHAEQDPEEIWRAVVAAVADALESAPASLDIAALGVAAQSGSVLTADAAGDHTSPLVTWMDERATPLVSLWEEESTATRVRSLTGWWPAPGLGLAILAWLSERESRDRPDRVGSIDSYVGQRLTGRWVTNPSNASGLQLMELDAAAWHPELCALAGVEERQLPVIESCGSQMGLLDAGAAAAMGMAPDVPVIHGGHDQTCTALALGLTEPGASFVSGGTAWVATVVVDSPEIVDLPRQVNVSPHVVADRWTRSRLVGDYGAALAVAPDAERRRGLVEEAGLLVGDSLGEMGAGADDDVVLVGGVTADPELTKLLAWATGRPVKVAASATWPAVGAARMAAAAIGMEHSRDGARSEGSSDGHYGHPADTRGGLEELE